MTTHTRARLGIMCFLTIISCDGPMGAQQTARRISGLSVPWLSRIEVYKSQSARLGAESSVEIRIALDSAAFDRLVEEAKTQGYKRLPSTEGLGHVRMAPYAKAGAIGWYINQEYPHDRGYRFVVLDARAHTLNIEQEID
jgi:hypothetical protein